MAEQLSWEAWQEKANAAYVKGQYGAQQMIADWGYPAGMTSEGYKIEFDKGKVKRKNREGRRAQRARANSLRALRAQTKGELEATDLAAKTREARAQSQSTLHRQTYGNKPSIVEHDVALQAGGSNTYTSISDPEFKQHKDDVEAAAYRRFGKDKVIVDIDDVSGDVRLIPAQYHNKFQATSQQPGIDVPMGADIDKALNTFESTKFKPTKLIDQLNLTPAQRRALNAADFDGKDRLLKEFKAAKPRGAGSPMGIDLIGTTHDYIAPPYQEGYGPGGIIRTLPTAHERL
jgi:hypothetical protein